MGARKKRRVRKREDRQISERNPSLKADTDNIYDDIDKYNTEYDENLLKLIKKPAKPLAKEVLRIASDDDDDNNSDESDTMPASNENYRTTTDKWGNRRQKYYGTSYVDRDYGTINDSEEEESLQFEEDDALIRQHKLEAANSHIDYDQLINFGGTIETNGKGLGEILQIQAKKIEEEIQMKDFIQDNEAGTNHESFSESEPNEDEYSPRERRGITYEIRKNKGIKKDKGRRKGKHSRVMKRIQYRKALIKKRSQVPDVRREMTKYDGEKRGIRISTVKSIKLS